jgi:tetratricopeptide (TPR) repeat protein
MPAPSANAGTPIPGGASARGAGWPALAGASALVLAACLAYCRTFSVPLVFDDLPSISDNATIRHLGAALSPPADSTVGGRPVLNLSFAINYAISGYDVWSYHALNLAIHALAGLALFGILRRALGAWREPAAGRIAFSASLLWILHPLLTESVTYTVQRAESLMGLFYLLTLYFFIRGADEGGTRKGLWSALSIGACLLGMGTKETMVSAPLVVFLYDRTFIAGSFREAWRLRRWTFVGLAATWIPLAALVISNQGRHGTAGYGGGVSAWSYAVTQFPAIVHYLWLCVWPHNLIFDYGSGIEVETLRVVPYVLVVAGLAAATVWGIVRRPALGFLGAVFFAVLAPSSSLVPVVTETLAEQRMYLGSIPVVVLAVLELYRWLRGAALPLCLALALVLLAATWRRNETYRSEEGLWRDTVGKLPENERAHYNLGCVLETIPGKTDEAIAEFAEAVRLRPDYFKAQNNLGDALQSAGRTREAVAHLEEALRLRPDSAEAHNNLGNAYRALGRTQDAVAQFEDALRLRPGYVEAHNNLGVALGKVPGRANEAVAQFEDALRLDPGSYQAQFNLGTTLKEMGRTAEAIEHYEAASRLRPGDPTIHFYLAGALLQVPGRTDEAVAQLREVLRLNPGDDRARRVLDRVEALRQ